MKYGWLIISVALLSSHTNAAVEGCGSLKNGYGPFDYWVDKGPIAIVLMAHFTPGVETLTQTATGPFGGDIDYTLRAIPNHPNALMSMMRLAEREKTERPRGARYSVECYFDRAMRFRPKDGMVRMVYAEYLGKHGRNKEALEQLEIAQDLLGANANLHYNIALAYFGLGQYDKSLSHAHKAYALGFNLPGLRNKLERAGKWREATPEEMAAIKAGFEQPDEKVPAAAAGATGESAAPVAAKPAEPAPVQPSAVH